MDTLLANLKRWRVSGNTETLPDNQSFLRIRVISLAARRKLRRQQRSEPFRLGESGGKEPALSTVTAENNKTAKKYGCIGCFGLLVIAAIISSILGPSPHDKKADEPHRPTIKIASPGDVLDLRADQFCMPTESGLDEIVRWSVRNDREEMTRSFIKNGGLLLKAGSRVKVLDVGFTKAKIRDVKTDHECWVVREATDH